MNDSLRDRTAECVSGTQIYKCTFVDTQAEPSYPDAMQSWLHELPLRCNHSGTDRALPRERGSSALHAVLRVWLRLSFRPMLHDPIEPKARKCRSQRGLRAVRLADISTQPPVRNIKWNHAAPIVLVISSLTPLALGAFVIASALAPQRFAGSTAPIALGATAIAAPSQATLPLIASALASQRSGFDWPRDWRWR
jgi:hypothetical protein